MEKVIGLLKDLSAKVTAEGKKEAAQYDKYACFCKEQADEKLYAIEKSEAKIKDLKAEIEELDTAIAELNAEISDLSKSISRLEGEIKKKTKKREKEHDAYLVKAKDMNEAIDACAAAIEALKDSKASMKGAKTSGLMQLTDGLVKAVKKQPMLALAPKAVALLSKLGDKAAPKFQYQSNDIIATLEDLLADFKEMKKNLDVDEFEVNSAFEKNKLSLSNEKKFAEQERAEKEAVVESKTEQLEAAKADRDEETEDMDADQSFLDVLTGECEAKAALFDQRSSTRADELKALSEATAELQSGAAPNFEANKKLVGLQKSKAPSSPVTLVQIRSVQNQQTGREVAIQKVRSYLDGAADRTGSVVLSAIAVRVRVAEDHFVKVRGLIKDLIQKLKEDAKAEATQKNICDKDMADALSDRDKANSQIEIANGKITSLTAKKNALLDEIDVLNKEISELQKALLEATELRAEDKADNEKTISMSDAGAESVKLALGILKKFYDNAFLQTSKYVPPKSDREGNTVGDLAPDAFGEKYHGSQSESKGIIGILDVILSDFERTSKKTASDEKEAQEEFEKFEKDTKDEVKEKNKKVKKNEGKVADAESDILDQQQALKDAEKLLDSATEALEDLEVMCVKGEETWEERKQKREEEIEALKEALNILEDWQK